MGGHRRPVDVGEDLPGLDQEGAPGRGQLHMVGGAVQQHHVQLTFEALQLLAQGRLDDVLAGGRPAEVQLLGQGDEVAQLAKLHARHLPVSCRGTSPATVRTWMPRQRSEHRRGTDGIPLIMSVSGGTPFDRARRHTAR